jgi:hypothetical protein
VVGAAPGTCVRNAQRDAHRPLPWLCRSAAPDCGRLRMLQHTLEHELEAGQSRAALLTDDVADGAVCWPQGTGQCLPMQRQP